tara:strand:+ start:260 stop:391 length:132 start_codon:yes stop_codon:yes gene_type:complete
MLLVIDLLDIKGRILIRNKRTSRENFFYSRIIDNWHALSDPIA